MPFVGQFNSRRRKMAKKDWRAKFEAEFPDFVDVVAGMGTEELDSKLLQYAKEAEAIRKGKEEKIGAILERMSEEKKTLEGPYKDAAKANNLKQRYIVHMIGERGGDDGQK